MLSRLHHIGIAVRSVDEALRFYRDALGLEVAVDRIMPREGVRGVLLPAGESEIELLESVSAGSSIAKFLEARGPGLHHICFETDNCAVELQTVSDRGAQLIDRVPRPGLAGQIGFLHPRSSHGVLVELATPPSREHEAGEGVGVVLGLEEIGIVVRDRKIGASTYARHFGFSYASPPGGTVESLGAQAAFLQIGMSRIALLEPAGAEGPTARFARDRGEGLLLLTLSVSDLPAAIRRLREHGVECGEPLPSGELFVLSDATCGVRLQLIVRPKSSADGFKENHG